MLVSNHRDENNSKVVHREETGVIYASRLLPIVVVLMMMVVIMVMKARLMRNDPMVSVALKMAAKVEGLSSGSV